MRPAFRTWGRPAVVITALCLLSGAAFAADDEPSKGTIAERTLEMAASPTARIEPTPIRLDGSILLGRISRNLERSGAGARLNYIADQSYAGARHDLGTLGAGETLARATKSAVKSILRDMLEQQTGLDDVVDRLQTSGGTGNVLAGGESGVARARFQVGISRYLPRLDVRLDNGAVATKISVTAYGTLGVDLAPAAGSRLAFHGGYDARSNTSEVRCLFRF